MDALQQLEPQTQESQVPASWSHLEKPISTSQFWMHPQLLCQSHWFWLWGRNKPLEMDSSKAKKAKKDRSMSDKVAIWLSTPPQSQIDTWFASAPSPILTSHLHQFPRIVTSRFPNPRLVTSRFTCQWSWLSNLWDRRWHLVSETPLLWTFWRL